MSLELPKRIRGNAAVSYALVFASLAFLTSKNPHFNHPFIKSHVKIAFGLHAALLGMLYFMSYPFLRNIKIFTLSLNDIITAILGLLIFGALIYCARKAYHGETILLSDITRDAKTGHSFLSIEKIDSQDEKQKALIILSHVPFIGYILAAQHRDNIRMQHIAFLNLIFTIISLAFVFFGLASLATIIFVLYIVWSVFVSLRLTLADEVTDINLGFLPTPEEKYILLRALSIYIKNIFDTKTFVELNTLRNIQREKKLANEVSESIKLEKLPEFPYPQVLLGVPFVNLIGLLYTNSRERLRIGNAVILTLLFLLVIIIFGLQSPVFLLALIPFCYHTGYSDRKGYHMPYVTDIYNIFITLMVYIRQFSKKTRELQKKDVSGSFTSQKDEQAPKQESTKKED